MIRGVKIQISKKICSWFAFCCVFVIRILSILIIFWSVISLALEQSQCKKLGRIFTGLTLFLSFTVIFDVSRSFIPHKNTFTKYCLTQWIFKAPQELWNPLSKAYLVNFMVLAAYSLATVFIIFFVFPSPRPLPCVNKKFLNCDGHQMALVVRSARVSRIQLSKST